MLCVSVSRKAGDDNGSRLLLSWVRPQVKTIGLLVGCGLEAFVELVTLFLLLFIVISVVVGGGWESLFTL